MAELVFEENLTASENLKVGDEFKIGDLLVCIDSIRLNNADDLILALTIVGETIKRRSKMMLILPKRLPIVTLK